MNQNSFKSICDRLESYAQGQDNDKGITYLNNDLIELENLTFKQIYERSQSIAAILIDKGVKKGDRVLLLYPPSVEYLCAFFGCLYAGAITVPVYPPSKNKTKQSRYRLRGIINDCRPKLILTNKSSYWAIKLSNINNFSLLKTKIIITDKRINSVTNKVPIKNYNSIAFLQYTSGSTAAPRGVQISHNNLMHNLKVEAIGGDFTIEDRLVSWLPLYHDMGLIGQALLSVYLGIPGWFISPVDFLKNPILWPQLITHYKATYICGPNFSFELLNRKVTEDEKKTLDLSSLRIVACGAEPINRKTIDDFYNAFRLCGLKKNTFFPTYGLAESTLAVTGGVTNSKGSKLFVTGFIKSNKFNFSDSNDHMNEKVQDYISCGFNQDSATLNLIVNPETGLEAEEFEVGELWTSGPSVAKGYWNNKEASKLTFQNYLAGDEKKQREFLRTGDLGFTDGKRFYVTGRLKEVIIINGENYYPNDIENISYRSTSLIRPGCVAAFSVREGEFEKIILVAEIHEDSYLQKEDDFSSIKKIIRQKVLINYGCSINEIIFIKEKTMSKTTSGKIQRLQCKRDYLKKNLDIVNYKIKSKPQTQEYKILESHLLNYFAEELELRKEEIDKNDDFHALGLTSIKAVYIADRISRELDLNVTPSVFWKHPTIRQLALYLEKNKNKLE